MSIKGRVVVSNKDQVFIDHVGASGFGSPNYFGQAILDFFNGRKLDYHEYNGEIFPAIEQLDMDRFIDKLKNIKLIDYQSSLWESDKYERNRRRDLGAAILGLVYHYPSLHPIYLIPADPGPVEWNYIIDLEQLTLSIFKWEWGTPEDQKRLIKIYDLDNLPIFFSEDFGYD